MLSSATLTILIIVLVAAVVVLVIIDPGRLLRRRRIDHRYEQLSRRVSERLEFRRPERTDLDFYLAMSLDPVAAESNGWSGREAEWVRRRFNDHHLFDQLQASEIVAVERASGSRVGTTTFTRSPLDATARSIGIHVHADHRQQGYGRELMAGAILLLQAHPGPVHVVTRVTNTGMQRIMQSLGFKPEPANRSYQAPNGESYDACWYQCGAETHPPIGVKPA